MIKWYSEKVKGKEVHNTDGWIKVEERPLFSQKLRGIERIKASDSDLWVRRKTGRSSGRNAYWPLFPWLNAGWYHLLRVWVLLRKARYWWRFGQLLWTSQRLLIGNEQKHYWTFVCKRYCRPEAANSWLLPMGSCSWSSSCLHSIYMNKRVDFGGWREWGRIFRV